MKHTKIKEMKNNPYLTRISSFLLVFILASGCLEYTITTRIMPDGSIERIMEVKGDSASIFKGCLPVPVDSTWEITDGFEERPQSDTSGEKTYVYKARKVYPNDKALNKELNPDSAGAGQVCRHVKVEKKFRWFNTFYRYEETYHQLFPFSNKPVNDYLTDDELKLMHADDNELHYSPDEDKLVLINDTLSGAILSVRDSVRMNELKKDIELKYMNWIKDNLFEAYFDVVRSSLSQMGIMKPEVADKTRDSLFSYLENHYEFELLMNEDTSTGDLLQLMAAYYNVDSARLHESNKKDFDELESKMEFLLPIINDSFTNFTIMPGLIIETNSVKINGNTASWDVDSQLFFEKDYVLYIESRTVNKGAIVISGIILTLVIILLVAGMVKKR
jgi:hypothetical protein